MADKGQKNSYKYPAEPGKTEVEVIDIRTIINENGKYISEVANKGTIQSFDISSLDLNEGVKIPVESNNVEKKTTTEVEHGE